MELLPLDKLGARQTAPGTFEFGVYFPWVSAADGNRVFVKLIHERDQFIKSVPAFEFELAHSVDAKYGDYWSAPVALASSRRARRHTAIAPSASASVCTTSSVIGVRNTA